MLKNLFISAAVALAATAAPAQETLYLIKGNKVIAKYSTAEVEYATFKLPAGVEDIDDTPTIQTLNFLGGTGSYFGTTDNVANFQIQLSTGAVGDESFPRTMLYLQFMSNAADYNDLKFEEGTYTIGDGATLDPFKFHPGISETNNGEEGIGGTFYIDMQSGDNATTHLVTDGTFTIKKTASGYKIAGILVEENGSVLNFNYEGAIAISNESDEKDPADELPLPESQLTADFTFNALQGEAYVNIWNSFFADEPRFDYLNFQIYGDSNYETCLQLGIIVDPSKTDGVKLPKGKYQLIKRTAANFAANDYAALPAWAVQSETTTFAPYGCWYITDYATHSPLTSGEIEVLEDSDLKTINITFTLKDPKGNTLSGSYNGSIVFF